VLPTVAPAASALPFAGSAAQEGTAVAGAPSTEGSVGAVELLAKVAGCTRVSKGLYRPDAVGTATVPVCDAKGAVFWKADMDIDCDGQVTTACNTKTDPWFLNQTAFQQSDGKPLNAEKLPYVVVPSPGTLWNYTSSDIRGGGVVAVIHGGSVQYAVVGDTGPAGIIGEASYATALALGIPADPARGGTASGVTYILFKGSRAVPIENHSAAVRLGDALAKKFVLEN
jgi:hypothetical protein